MYSGHGDPSQFFFITPFFRYHISLKVLFKTFRMAHEINMTSHEKLVRNSEPNSWFLFKMYLHVTRFFYKKLGSGHSSKSFLISYEIFSILVLKVS